MAAAMLDGWMRLHPKLCAGELGSFDLETALLALKEVVSDISSSELLANHKCKNSLDPIQLLEQGFSEQIELMLRTGCHPEQIKEAMDRFEILYS